jgi:hypothetical protein
VKASLIPSRRNGALSCLVLPCRNTWARVKCVDLFLHSLRPRTTMYQGGAEVVFDILLQEIRDML